MTQPHRFVTRSLIAAAMGSPLVASAQDFLTPPGGLSASGGHASQNLGAFNIVINPGSGLAGNAAALAAFNRAAAQWEAYISDPITVTIDADLGSLGSGIIGAAGSVILQADYDTLRNAMVADAADELDDSITAFLPTAAQFSATLNSGMSLSGNLILSKANAKALGFGGLDGVFGVSDATITFSNSFAFDFDNSNGVTAGTMDFETVAAHEIGHALGFFSAVDDADYLLSQSMTGALDPTLLDLYRFRDGSANDPSTNVQFTTFARDLVPGQSDVIDDLANEWGLSTGLTQGDGRQASHWKDDGLTGTYVGLMDPTLSYGVVETLTAADLRALDLIGYEITVVPEPSSLALGSLALGMLLRRRRS